MNISVKFVQFVFLLQTLTCVFTYWQKKNAPRTHVKPSILYSSQVTDPDGILSRDITVQAITDSFARNDTVISPTDIMDRLDHSKLELTLGQ